PTAPAAATRGFHLVPGAMHLPLPMVVMWKCHDVSPIYLTIARRYVGNGQSSRYIAKIYLSRYLLPRAEEGIPDCSPDRCDISFGAALDCGFAVAIEHAVPPAGIDAVELVGADGFDDRLHRPGVERHQIGERVHEADPAPVGHDHDGIAGHQHALVVGAVGPVQHGRAGEVAAGADEGDPFGEPLALAAPEFDGAVGPHHPVAVVFVEIDRHTAERPAPVDHGGVKVRVRNGDRPDPAFGLDGAQRGIGDERGAVPHHAALRPLDHQGPFADGDLRARADAEQPRLDLAQVVDVVFLERVERRPALAVGVHILPVVGADQADLARRVGFGIADAAGRADV